MEISRRRKSSSGDTFSFPGTPNYQDQDFDFEFGFVTPCSPFNDPNKNSLADHLFFNGMLLPHAYPIQSTSVGSYNSQATSRTSSVSSKDSLMSSRSNSYSSRSSSCSSARTSSSDNSERLLLSPAKVVVKTAITRERCRANRPVLAQSYGHSKKWQLITPPPVLNLEISRRKKAVQEELRAKKQADKRTGASSGFGRRFLRSVLSTCRECHAMKPSTKDEVLREKMKLQ